MSDITHLKFEENDSFSYFCRKQFNYNDTDRRNDFGSPEI